MSLFQKLYSIYNEPRDVFSPSTFREKVAFFLLRCFYAEATKRENKLSRLISENKLAKRMIKESSCSRAMLIRQCLQLKLGDVFDPSDVYIKNKPEDETIMEDTSGILDMPDEMFMDQFTIGSDPEQSVLG